jgi:1-acyl-sn-glycerol-3-phosphate acyltransferase
LLTESEHTLADGGLGREGESLVGLATNAYIAPPGFWGIFPPRMPLAPTLVQIIASTETGIRAAEAIARGLQANMHDADRVPRRGPALIVGNHSYLGIDSIALAALLITRTGRMPRFLAERNLWKIPGAAGVLDAVGAIPGAPDDAVRLLSEGELVTVYPGGIDDSFKLSSEAYQLHWKHRSGFAKVALRAGAPIVPVAATGIDEVFEVPRRETFFGRFFLGSSRYDLPVPRSVRRVPLDFYVRSPILPEGEASDAEAVERTRKATYDALESVLAPYRERVSK